MNFSIKNTLRLCILLFTWSFLHGGEVEEEDPYPIKYEFYKEKDCIKVKVILPLETSPNTTLYKIKSPNPKGVAVQIKNNSLDYSETFYQLANIEMYALSSREEGGLIFEIISNVEKTDGNIVRERITRSAEHFLKPDEHVDFRRDVIPKLTFSKNSPNIKYVRFFTKS